MASVLYLPLYLLATAATTWAVSQRYLGNEATILSSFQAIKSKLAALLLTIIMAYLLVAAGFILLIIPAIIFGFWITFISQVVILEDKKYKNAIGRSRWLAGGQWMRIFVLAILTSIIVGVGQTVITMPFEIIGYMTENPASISGGLLGLVYGLASGIAVSLVTPLQTIVFVLLYYDVRIRKEAFDLEMLAEGLGISGKDPLSEQETIAT